MDLAHRDPVLPARVMGLRVSNHPRRHTHAPRENRAARVRAEYEAGRIPCVPGVVTDREQATIDEALAQGHHVLPFIPDTVVTIRLFEVEIGLEIVAERFGPGAARQVRNLLAARGGTDPAIVLTTREPRD